MMYRNIQRLSIIFLCTLIVLGAISAYAANIVVPTTRLMDQSQAILASELAPAECSSISSALTVVIVCSGGSCNGSNADELILGTAGADEIDGKNGMDCIVGGAGDDSLNGGNDDDVLVGAAGNDTLDGGRKKDTDVCYDTSGTTTFIECDLTP